VKYWCTAALALVAWYLMMPPPGAENAPNARAPLGDWVVDSLYDTPSACRRELSHFQRSLQINLREHENTHAFVAWAPQAAALATCVSSDDPRLNLNDSE
jgi:hypothetical protein